MSSPNFSFSFLRALGTDETRAPLVLVHVTGGSAYCSDGHRMHVEPCAQPDGVYTAIGSAVPDMALHPMTSVLQVTGELPRRFELPDSAADDLTYMIAQLPRDCRLVVDLGNDDWHVVIERPGTHLKRIKQARQRYWTLRSPDEVTLDRLLLPAPWGTETPNWVSINAQYLLDALRHTRDTTLHYNGARDPWKLQCEGRTALGMPVAT